MDFATLMSCLHSSDSQFEVDGIAVQNWRFPIRLPHEIVADRWKEPLHRDVLLKHVCEQREIPGLASHEVCIRAGGL